MGKYVTVERGAALLDDARPGWEDKINLETLDLGTTFNCVVGQLHGRRTSSYERGLKRLGLDGEYGSSAHHGFTTWGGGTFEGLTNAWRRLIERRRASRS